MFFRMSSMSDDTSSTPPDSDSRGNDENDGSIGNKSDRFDSSKRRSNFRNYNKTMNHQAYLNANKTFEGVTPEIGGVLGLPTEGYMTKRVTFEKFQELMVTYAVKKYTEAASTEISEAIRDLKDPVNLYVTNKMPKIDAKIEKGSVEKMILKEEVREFVRVKNMVISSVNKLFALIWGQCTDGLKSILKMDVEY